MDYPNIKVTPPGPEARAIVEKTGRFLSPSYTYTYPLVVKGARGMMIEDVDGNKYLDLVAGMAVLSTGHAHPDVVKAIAEQAGKFIHISGTDFYYETQADLAEKITSITPGKTAKKAYLCSSGAEAIECAVKLARWHTKRKQIIAFFGAFHGRTMGALSLTASKARQREGFFPMIPGVTHTAFAYCYRCPWGQTPPLLTLEPNASSQKVAMEGSDPKQCDTYCVKWIEERIFKHTVPPEDVAAIVVEPIQGEGGYVVPPAEFHQRLAELCRRYGILYVVDEIQTGMGRTGKMFASEHFGVVPDIICIGKGIASGMPIGAVVSSDKIMSWPPGSHASTFGGNPVVSEAGLATIKLIENGLIENADKIGRYIIGELKKMMDRHPIIGDVRGLGLMIGIELVKDRKTKEKAIEERNKIVRQCFEKGLIILGCGENVLRLSPPLIITKEDADKALTILDETLGEKT